MKQRLVDKGMSDNNLVEGVTPNRLHALEGFSGIRLPCAGHRAMPAPLTTQKITLYIS